MNIGSVAGNFRIIKEGDLVGDQTSVLYCRNCGYIELYKEASTREPWRLGAPTPSSDSQESQEKEEPRQPQEETPRKAEKRLIR